MKHPRTQRRHVAVTSLLLAAVALAFFVASIVQQWR